MNTHIFLCEYADANIGVYVHSPIYTLFLFNGYKIKYTPIYIHNNSHVSCWAAIFDMSISCFSLIDTCVYLAYVSRHWKSLLSFLVSYTSYSNVSQGSTALSPLLTLRIHVNKKIYNEI